MERGVNSMTVGRPPITISLTETVKKELIKRLNSRKTPVYFILRASIILMASKGIPGRIIAQKLNVSENTVDKWRKRFLKGGIKGLEDAPRSGPKPKYTQVQRMQIISIACEPSIQKNGINGWTIRRIREETIRRGIAKDISESTVWRILNEVDLKPYKVRGWIHSPDPQFKEKVNEIVNLYTNPPTGAVILSIDEKTGMQAIERRFPDEPANLGKATRREFEYKRHGTQSLIAALNIMNGKVTSRCGKTRKAKDLMLFMEQVARENTGVEIHVIWDNLNIHKGERWEKFNKKHGGRFHFHYTPIHASWVNQIEIFFGIIARKCLRNGNFRSVQELKNAVEEFIKYWNEEIGHPFKWTFKGYPLQA